MVAPGQRAGPAAWANLGKEARRRAGPRGASVVQVGGEGQAAAGSGDLGPRLRVGLVSLYALENNGVRHLSAVLRGAGWSVTEVYFKDWVNNHFPWPSEREIDALIDLLREQRVSVIGLSVRASAFHRVAAHITHRLRAALGLRVIWGGMHPTFQPERCIAIADAIAVGEVDLAVVDYFLALEAGSSGAGLPGFWVREGDEIVRADLAPLVDLATLPFRDYHTQLDKWSIEGDRVQQGDPFISNPEFTVLASRGCPYWTCTFCSNTVTKPLTEGLGPTFRIRPVEDLIRELESVRALCPDIKVVRFDDEVFPLHPAWIAELAEKWPQRVGLPFEVLVDPRMVREAPLRQLKAAGLRALCMGIQASERVNRELYHRPVSDAQIIEAQRIFRAVGVRSNLQLIWDDPMSTEADKDSLFRLLMALEQPFELYLFGLTLYPETHLARRLLREGWVTEADIEGLHTRAFEQFRVDLSYPRPAADQRWLALIVLLNKRLLPKSLIWKLYASEALRSDPRPLVAFAQAANLVKMSAVVAELLRDGELSPLLLRRWLNPRSLVTM